MAIFTGGALGTLVRIVCPHCGEVQARARKAPKSVYACRKCHRRFTREDADTQLAARDRPRRR